MGGTDQVDDGQSAAALMAVRVSEVASMVARRCAGNPRSGKSSDRTAEAGRATEVTAREVMVAGGVDGADGREDCVAQGPIGRR